MSDRRPVRLKPCTSQHPFPRIGAFRSGATTRGGSPPGTRPKNSNRFTRAARIEVPSISPTRAWHGFELAWRWPNRRRSSENAAIVAAPGTWLATITSSRSPTRIAGQLQRASVARELGALEVASHDQMIERLQPQERLHDGGHWGSEPIPSLEMRELMGASTSRLWSAGQK